MDLTALCEQIAAADALVAVGARTQWEVGNPVDARAINVRAPDALVAYEPADMTVTVGAGMTFAALDVLLAEHGQECALDPRDGAATIGGIIAAGVSGPRRLRHGPLRDHVLEVRFVTGDGRVVKGGGPTVKNVTGYDLPRLFVGSLGTLGVLTQCTLRCRPRAATARWYRAADDGVPAVFRPSTLAWDGTTVLVLLEGAPADVDAQARELSPCDPPSPLDGAHRGRVSVAPAVVRALTADLHGVSWRAELGVGTVHVATDTPAALAHARDVAHQHGGWLLREAGAPELDGFGRELPNAELMRRIKTAFDPEGKFAPGRLPL